MNDAHNATRFAIELRLRVEAMGQHFVVDGTEDELRRAVGQYVRALKALELGQNDACAALRAVLHEAARTAHTEAEDSASVAAQEQLRRQVIVWGTEAYGE